MSPQRKTSTPRQELLKIEKKIFDQNRKIIKNSANVTDKNFKRYHANYKKAVKTFKRVVKIEQVENDVFKSRVVLVGDYHTLDQSQRSFIRLLRHYFRNKDSNVIVALETVQKNHQRHLNAFMCDKIDASQFIKKIGFKQSWFFDLWQYYEVIFDFLKYHDIPIFGIETTNNLDKSLNERDKFMADQIVGLAQKYPDKKIFVLVGDLHLAPQHLPKEIQKRAKKINLSLPIVSLYQNSSEIYWQLSKKNLVDYAKIVKLSDLSYCRMHTPPIIVQQSYINWLYHEAGHFDWIDAKGSFTAIVERIAQVLGLTLPNDYENVEVYTCGDLSFIKRLSKKDCFTKKELKFICDQIKNSESYFLPKARIVYIANVSIHHAAEEASHYIKFLFSGIEFPRLHLDAFYANVLHEALGFFGSKLINSRRKCPRFKDFKNQIKFLEQAGLLASRQIEYKTCQLFIDHTKLVKKGQVFPKNKITEISSQLFLSLSHALGYDLGELLYYGFMDGLIDKKDICKLYVSTFSEEGETYTEYLRLVKCLKKVKRPVRLS